MVLSYGLGRSTGVVSVGDLGAASGDTKRRVDAEVQQLLDESYARSKALITRNRDKLDRLAQGLLRYETITLDEIARVVDGKPLDRDV